VLGYADAANASDASQGELEARAEALASRKGGSLWAALFYAHARFFLDSQGAAGTGTALQVGSMAARMGEDNDRLEYFFDHPDEAAQVQWVPPQYPAVTLGLNESMKTIQEVTMLLSALLVVSAVFNIVVFTKMNAALGRMKHKREGK